MIKLDTEINLDIRGFLQWWGAELVALLPEGLRNIVTVSRDYLEVSETDSRFRLQLVNGGAGREFSQVLSKTVDPNAWDGLLKLNSGLKDLPLVLRLNNRQALHQTVSLPAAAESNLHQVIGFEMERLTPFKAEQVYYDAQVIEKKSGLKQIRVGLALTPRETLDSILERLAGFGIHPGQVDVFDIERLETSGLSYNLLPDSSSKKTSSRKRQIHGLLLTLLIALIVVAIGLPMYMKSGYINELENKVRKEAGVAKKILTLKKEAEAVLRESDFLLTKKSDAPGMTEVLNELTERIPTNTWLTQFNYRDGKLQLHGQSPQASTLIGILEASSIFTKTSFISPVNQDRSTGMERFQIVTHVVRSKQNDP